MLSIASMDGGRCERERIRGCLREDGIANGYGKRRDVLLGVDDFEGN